MSDWKKSLESMIGVKGIETLSKAIHRRDSDSTIGPLDVYLPLLVVPRTILSWLVHNIKPIPIGESKKLSFPGMDDIEITIDKQGVDSYKGEFIKDGKVIHTFEKQTLPNVGGNFMSMGEMYDGFAEEEKKEEDEDEDEECEVSPDMAMPQAIMQVVSPEVDRDKLREYDSAVLGNLTYSLGKLIDALVSNHGTTSKISEAIASVKDDEESDLEKEAKKEFDDGSEPDVAAEANKILDSKGKGNTSKQIAEDKVKRYNELEVKTIKRFFDRSMNPKIKFNKADMAMGPSGQAAPSRPSGINKPELPNREQKPQSSQAYFNKLKARSRAMVKAEVKEYHVKESDMYTNCMHCGVPEFVKSEDGPKYKPCACFYITLKSEEGNPVNFVQVTKKKEGGYSLIFNKNADKDTVNTFLMTLKKKLLAYKTDLD